MGVHTSVCQVCAALVVHVHMTGTGCSSALDCPVHAPLITERSLLRVILEGLNVCMMATPWDADLCYKWHDILC